MTFSRLWFPAAIVVGVVLGLVFGLATDTDTEASPVSTSTTTSTTVDEGGTTTSTPDDTTTSTDPDDTTSTTDETGETTPTTAAPQPGVFTTGPGWRLASSSTGGVPSPFPVPEQTALLVADIDGDGADDIIIGGRRGPNSVQWLQRTGDTWEPRLIDADELAVEAGGATYDIDGDGDLDIVFGGDFSSEQVWWWENPAPDFDVERWERHTIKTDGGSMHHDMIFADIDGTGTPQLVFWNQRADVPTLFAATIPADPRSADQWERREVWTVEEVSEGLDALDLNNDGDIDLLAGGTMLLNDGAGVFDEVPIAPDLATGRARIAQLIEGGAPELIFDSGDGFGNLAWFRWNGEEWIRNVLRDQSNKGHSLDIGDVDGDGDLDLLSAEMRLDAGDAARTTLFINDGVGGFTETTLAVGMDNHESKLADIDGDGDLDVVSKPFNWFTPRLDVWINDEVSALAAGWERTVVDANRPDRAVFVFAGDVDGDGDDDLVSGPWVYENPGDFAPNWPRTAIGEPLRQAVLLEDLDRDGDLDIFGTRGVGSAANARTAWAQNNGAGEFTVLTNVPDGAGDFVQGAAVGAFGDNERIRVLLSWHEADRGIQSFSPRLGGESDLNWDFSTITSESQDEALSVGDIDDDGDVDIMMGTQWLSNAPGGGSINVIHEPATGTPDRHRLLDMDGDGDLDVVVSYEDAENGRVAWYEQGEDPRDRWEEHPIASLTMGLSLDVADMDGDGDLDVVVGEHSTSDPTSMSLLVFENGGDGRSWLRGRIFTGDEHHDGAILSDLDGDGDLDIASIGWTHGRVVIYENPAR